MICFAILGLGTVGSGVYEVVTKKGNSMAVKVKAILSIKEFSEYKGENLFINHFNQTPEIVREVS